MLGAACRGRFWLSVGLVCLLLSNDGHAQSPGVGLPATAGKTTDAVSGRLSGNVEDRRSEAASPRFVCGNKRSCRDMENCAEAIFNLQRCGLKSLAGNREGIPCVGSVCRQGTPGWEARLPLESQRDQPWTSQGLTPALKGTATFVAPAAAASADNEFDCAGKKYCKQMTSCKEARYRLTVCRDQSLDRDGDGVPCESICR